MCDILFNASLHTNKRYLQDDGSDEGVDGRTQRESRALEIPQHDAALRKDGKPI